MPSDSLVIEVLKSPQTWAILVAVMGLVGSFRVVVMLVSIIKHREVTNDRQLAQLEGIAECQSKLLAALGQTYSQLLEVKERLSSLDREDHQGGRYLR